MGSGLRESRPMVTARRIVGVLAGAVVAVLVTGGAAIAQTSIDPTITPVRNTGGWIFWLGVAERDRSRSLLAHLRGGRVHAVRAEVREG